MRTSIRSILYTYQAVTTAIAYMENDVLFIGPSIILTPYMLECAQHKNITIYRVESNVDRFLLVGDANA